MKELLKESSGCSILHGLMKA